LLVALESLVEIVNLERYRNEPICPCIYKKISKTEFAIIVRVKYVFDSLTYTENWN